MQGIPVQHIISFIRFSKSVQSIHLLNNGYNLHHFDYYCVVLGNPLVYVLWGNIKELSQISFLPNEFSH